MSSSKENTNRAIFHSKKRQSLKNMFQSNNFYSTTHTLFPPKKNPLKLNEVESIKLANNEFQKTLAQSHNFDAWVRPQTKHAIRNVSSRPQTSKGFRKQPTRNITFLNIQNQHLTDIKTKTTLNSKRQSKKPQKQQNKQHGLLFENWEKFRPREQQIYYKRENNMDEIQIVINKKGFINGRKGPSLHKNKFQTDLDDEFLDLFAD